MEIERQETNESQIGYFFLPKQHDNTDVIIISDDEAEEATFEPKKKMPKLGFPRDNVDAFEPKKKKPKLEFPRDNVDAFEPKLGFPRDNVDSFDELSKMFGGLPELQEDNDDLWFTSIYDLSEKKKTEEDKKMEEKKKTEEEKKKDDDKKKYGHVSLDDLGVTVEDLKRIPWEAFDPTWEIRSWARDPWLGGYMQDMFSPPYFSDI